MREAGRLRGWMPLVSYMNNNTVNSFYKPLILLIFINTL